MITSATYACLRHCSSSYSSILMDISILVRYLVHDQSIFHVRWSLTSGTSRLSCSTDFIPTCFFVLCLPDNVFYFTLHLSGIHGTVKTIGPISSYKFRFLYCVRPRGCTRLVISLPICVTSCDAFQRWSNVSCFLLCIFPFLSVGPCS